MVSHSDHRQRRCGGRRTFKDMGAGLVSTFVATSRRRSRTRRLSSRAAEGRHTLAEDDLPVEQGEPQKVRPGAPRSDQPPHGGASRRQRWRILNEIAGKDGDMIGFDKFSNRTYLDVKENEKSYCEWAKTIY